MAAMLAAPELARLDAVTPPFDPLEVLAWTHQERPHTRFLAWLLDPHAQRPGGGHGFGTSVLRALVTRAVHAVEALPGVELATLPRAPGAIDAAGLSVLREQPFGDGVRTSARAPDLRCLWRDANGDAWVVLIENKIDAGEGDGQTRDYLAWAARAHPGARRMLLYVTPDGRSPDSAPADEVVVPLTWSEVAEAALDAIAHLPAQDDTAARTFATSVLDALRMRFGGRADVRALVEALYDAHPRAAALAASPATEPSLLEGLLRERPNAAWHLRTLRPRAHRWTRAWADRVSDAFRTLRPDAPALTACAPHAERPDMASWRLADITDALSLHLFCTSGSLFGSHRPRAWVALRAPNMSAADVFEHREQRAALDALPEPTRAWLLGATPVFESPGAWRWLCVGAPAALTRAFSHDDDARRTARAFDELVGAHLDALAAFARDDAQRLYSCDLDPDHVIPNDARDREALREDAAPGARRVLLVTRQPTAHPYELRHERDLGLALGAAFGATGSVVYDYGPSGSLPRPAMTAPDVVVASLDLFRPPDDSTAREAAAVVHEAIADGATLVLWGARASLAPARRLLGAVVAPLGDATRFEDFPDGDAELMPAHAAFAALPARDGRYLQGALCAEVAEGACTGLHVRTRRGTVAALIAGWRVGAARVVFWGCAWGAAGRGLRERPEVFARWWQALMAFAGSL